ncbi:hypothetical protein [Azospirillum sp. SYSU D00513]|uniref:hypothetical protein n=1 Tax=Azospirillum sp. SYSU D00513 TaxID=2812561 RepID=UPI001A962C67|nr:hypothetical protein [Azospirillum sp. SYSU D00513]
MTRAPSTYPSDIDLRYDGPAPAGARRCGRLGGRKVADALARTAARDLHGRLAAEARLGAARRRRILSPLAAAQDPWLLRLTATLAHHRSMAVRGAGTGPEIC